MNDTNLFSQIGNNQPGKVADIMKTEVIQVGPDEKMAQVEELLRQNQINALPVVDKAGQVLGLITRRELFSADYEIYLPMYVKFLTETEFIRGADRNLPYVTKQITRTTAKEIMNRDARFARPEMSLEQLALIFVEKGISPLPVVDSSNQLLGMVSKGDLIKYLIHWQPVKDPLGMPSKERHVDRNFVVVEKDLNSRFAIITKAKANIWLTTAIVLFIVGFIAGVFYVADYRIF